MGGPRSDRSLRFPSSDQQSVPLDYAVTKVAMARLVIRAVALGLPIDRLVIEPVMHQRWLRRIKLGHRSPAWPTFVRLPRKWLLALPSVEQELVQYADVI